MFSRVKDKFKGYPPFYYHYANRALKTGDKDLAKECFETFEELWRDILRPDPLMAAAAVAMLSFIDFNNEPQKAEKYIALAENNLRAEDDGILRFGLATAKAALGKNEDARILFQHNIDFDLAVSESQLALSNLKKDAPILEGIENQHYLTYEFEEKSDRKEQQKVVEEIKKMAEHGEAEAQFRLGKLYRDGVGVEKNKDQVYHWFRKSAEQDNADAQAALGKCYQEGLGIEKDEEQAVDWLRKAAEQGNADAQAALGFCYLEGLGVKEDEEQAVDWLRKASKQDNADAQAALGNCYLHGYCVEVDEEQAVDWLRKAAEQDNVDAQVALGKCYLEGLGVEKDEEQAIVWLRKAAEQDNAEGQVGLGEYLFRHCGKKEKIQYLISDVPLFSPSLLGVRESAHYLFYRDIKAVQEQAVDWFRKAAEQDNARGQWFLGQCYENALGVDKDDVEAFKWYEKAADQGNAEALRDLSRCYLNGIGVAKDKEKARELLSIAQKLGAEDAPKLPKKAQKPWWNPF